MPKVFVSYSWDTEDHKQWVRTLATRLRNDGVDVTLDQWDLVPGDQLPQFMECAVRDSDFVLIICTPRYKQRSDGRQGGVGYEGDIMTGEVLTCRNQRKFIPVLRAGSWKMAAPVWLLGKYYIDLSDTPHSVTQYEDLLATLLGARPTAPPLGSPRARTASAGAQATGGVHTLTREFEPIRIVGLILDQVGAPRDDGTRGSALYSVPFRLSQNPPTRWADLFVHFWDHPPTYTSRHRPGIARVIGDNVILDGTTVEEVKEYHRETLMLVCRKANEKYSELLRNTRDQEERERKRLMDHRRRVEGLSKDIKFDDET